MPTRVVLCLVLCVVSALAVSPVVHEEQIHLTFVSNSQVGLSFVSPAPSAFVKSGLSSQNSSSWTVVPASRGRFSSGIGGYLYTTHLDNLTPHSNYSYSIGNETAFGEVYDFTHVSAGRQPVMAVMADFGLGNDVSMANLLSSSAAGEFDAMAVFGDLSYNLMTNNSQVGNQWLNTLGPIIRSKPFVVAAGNHEAHHVDAGPNKGKSDNFTSYATRFNNSALTVGASSGSNSPFYYSFNMGLIHYVVIDTEVYLFYNETQASPYPFQPEEQLEWLDKDLAAVDRSVTPWVVVGGHKPWYVDFTLRRKGKDGYQMVGNFTAFNSIFVKHHVDLYLTGHVHILRRFYPLNGPAELVKFAKPQDVDKACVSDDGHTYTNPEYPTTIVVGSPGDDEETTAVQCLGYDIIEPALRGTYEVCIPEYGYGLLTAPNSTALSWKWKLTGPPSKGKLATTVPEDDPVKDYLWIVRT